MPLKRRPFYQDRNKPVKLVDLCKINTDTFRHMTDAQLRRAERAIGTTLDFTQKEIEKGMSLRLEHQNGRPIKKLPERKSGVVNYILSRFISELRSSREPMTRLRPDQEAKMNAEWIEKYGKPMPTNEQVREGNRREAERNERLIWDLQARVGCQLKPDEIVARDAAREGNKPAVARIRKKPLIR